MNGKRSDAQAVNRPLFRMYADIDAAFELFGDAASTPALLANQLTADPTDPAAISGSTTPDVGPRWTARAGYLIQEAAEGSEAALRQCAAQAFDDPDPRVRGLAWCVLAEIQDKMLLEGTVDAIISDEFKKHVPVTVDPRERDEAASAFPILMSATIACASSIQFRKALEQEYIESHAGTDALAIESSLAAALGFLIHPNSDRRLAALQVLSRAPRRDKAVRNAIYKTMTSDPDSEVRTAAILAYSKAFTDTSEPQCLRELADLVLDEGQPLWCRFVAYSELFTVCGRFSEYPLRRVGDETLARLRDGTCADWPVQMDREFVEKCARGIY